MNGLEFIIKTYKTNSNQVATLLGISRQTINDWIKGRRHIPDQRLKQLSKHFGIQMEYFKKKELNDVEKIEVQKNFLLQTEEEFDFEHRYRELELESSQEATISNVRELISRDLYDVNDIASLNEYILDVVVRKLKDKDTRKLIEFIVYNLDLKNGVRQQFKKYETHTKLTAKVTKLFKEIQMEF